MGSKTHIQSKPPTQKHCHCHHLYPRRPKPLYSPLPPDTIRVARIVPGTRRGEYTAQMLEVPLITDDGEVTAELEYDVLRLSCDPEVKAGATQDSAEVEGKDVDTSKGKGKVTSTGTATTTATNLAIATARDTASNISSDHTVDQTLDPTAHDQNQQPGSFPVTLSIPSTTPLATATTTPTTTNTTKTTPTNPSPSTPQFHTNQDQEKSFFPILSLGGGEHVIEIPLVVKKAIEKVVGERWDGVHANVATFATARRGSAGQGSYDRDAAAADGATDGATADVDYDSDDDSIPGSGEDFYLWIAALCIDTSDTEDRRQQGALLERIQGAAGRIISV